jgi:class 3 adenylate cyclase/pimeloyl-ACP methyl ester carboxylesterase
VRDSPETRYAKAKDGIHIAYQTVGDGPLDLAFVTGWSHLEARWENPQIAHFLNRLASFSRLIVFDRRGTGESDPLPTERGLSWEEWADDLGLVLDTVGSERTALLGFGEGGSMAALYAATHPERTAALVLLNSAPRWVSCDDYPWGVVPEQLDPLLDMYEQTWGTGLSPLLMTSRVDEGFRRWWGRYERMCASPARARAFITLMFAGDVRSVLPLVQCPTLVLSRDGSNREIVDYLAARIPNATPLIVPDTEFLPYLGDADASLDAVEEFLTGFRPIRESDRALATVLFTDIVGSTSHATRLGDTRWTQVLNDHDSLVSRELERHRGRLVKHTGDGVLATFDGPGRAVRCAQSIVEGARPFGIEVRAGIHTGEIEWRGDDVGGIAVHIGQRVSALAEPGEVLVSRTVTDLVAGSGLRFEERGEYELKGVAGSWKLLAAVI